MLIGVFSGLGAAAFQAVLQMCTELILGGLVRHHPATLASDGGYHPATGFFPVWAVPLVVAGGALVATAFAMWAAPEAAGHGTDAAIHAAHHNPHGTPLRVAWTKLVAAGIVIGSGGSGGSEGPTAQITAALASKIARTFRLSFQRAKTVVAVGMGAGVGAIFRSPLGGTVLGAEILYRSAFEAKVIAPGLISSAVAFVVFGLCHGFDPFFGTVSDYHWDGVLPFLAFPLLGLLAGLMGRLYIRSFYGVAGWFSNNRLGRRIPRLLRPALAGALVGGIGMTGIPGVLGTGYGVAQAALDANTVLLMSLGVVIAIPFVKILATSLSIGSGGSGGIFGPGIVIGAATGAALWRLLEPFGLAPTSPAPFVIAAMAACLGSIAHAPLALIVMTVETTNNLSMLVPTLVATGVACFVVGDRTLYRSQLGTQTDAPTRLAPAPLVPPPAAPLQAAPAPHQTRPAAPQGSHNGVKPNKSD